MFTKYIYKLVSNRDAVRMSTLDVLANFERDGVMHLELRTTPRVGPSMSGSSFPFPEQSANV